LPPNRVAGARRRWRSMQTFCWRWSRRSLTWRWTRSSARCVNKRFAAVGRRCGGFFSGTRSRSKKSLYATEQQRADVARARRCWMREQGLFDPARLVFID